MSVNKLSGYGVVDIVMDFLCKAEEDGGGESVKRWTEQ